MSKKPVLQGKLNSGADGFQRLNFLYQACHTLLNSIPNCPQLTSLYGNSIVSIGKKLQLKMDPSLKRTLCKGCKGLLIPGKTAQVQILATSQPRQRSRTKRKTKALQWKCVQCSSVRLFVLKPGFLLWTEKQQSV